MKKNQHFSDCNTYDEIATRAAEYYVWNMLCEYGYKSFHTTRDDDRQWIGFANAIFFMFDDDSEERTPDGRCIPSEFKTLVNDITAKVEAAGGVDFYDWSWNNTPEAKAAVQARRAGLLARKENKA